MIPRMDEQPKPFVAPCRELPLKAPLEWLKSGWRDLRAARGVSLAWGGFCWFLSTVITWLAWKTGGWVLLISLLSGFIFVAPLLAFGMYSVSRQLCLGRRPTLAWTLRAAWRPLSNSLVFALVLLVVLLLWARAGAMVHIFFPSDGEVKLRELATFLIVGSAVGSVFAAITFATSVFSLPFIANRDVDVVTAVVSSINAVLRNRRVMLLWALLLAFLTGVGFATAMVGFIVIIPWLGYATWHGYRAALDVSGWETL
ncbi:MAG: DUF2189 domain-containing protein [Lysobacterales bacterium]|nr:MAG: DUF2189 domain-containing protein [Xanthomonadales bacterium]